MTRWAVGDRVAGIFHQGWIAGDITDEMAGTALGGDLDGVLTEYRAFDQHGLVAVPEGLSFQQAATLPVRGRDGVGRAHVRPPAPSAPATSC